MKFTSTCCPARLSAVVKFAVLIAVPTPVARLIVVAAVIPFKPYWKIVCENFLECYHCQVAHPAFAEVIDRRCARCHAEPARLLPRSLSDERGVSFWQPDMHDPRLNTSRHSVFNLSRPDHSLLLLAPLAQPAGGWGLCRDPQTRAPVTVFADTRDPDYQTVLALCDAGKTLMIVEPDGTPVQEAHKLEKFAWANNGTLLGTNRKGLFRVERKTGIIHPVMDFPPPPLPELQPGGTGPCCDIQHLYDLRAARGVFLVAPAGLPEVWVLDDGDLHLRSKWTPDPIMPPLVGQKTKILAIRQVGVSLSTGWVWLVAQIHAEPLYDARVLVYRYPLPFTAGGPSEF